MKKRLLAFAALALLAASLMLTIVPAADDGGFDYEGELDLEEGTPVAEETDIDPNRKEVSRNVFYDEGLRAYVYRVGSAEIGVNVPDGAVVQQKVKLTVPDGLPVTVTRDGQDVTQELANGFSEQGKYAVIFAPGEKDETALSFTIVNELTGTISSYRLPAGFQLLSLTYNGQAENVNTRVIDFEKEGKYTVEYCCVATGMRYMLNLTIDHTPPTLKLEAVKNGYASGPVDISDLEKGVAVSVYRNDEQIRYEEKLTVSGRYRIVLEDKAGNRNTYTFVIRVYFNFNAIVFFVLIAAFIGVLVAWVLYKRKHFRIC